MFNRKTLHSKNKVLMTHKGDMNMRRIGNLPIIRRQQIQDEKDDIIIGKGFNAMSLKSTYIRPVLQQSNLLKMPFEGDRINQVINGKGVINDKKKLPLDLRRRGNRNNIKLIL